MTHITHNAQIAETMPAETADMTAAEIQKFVWDATLGNPESDAMAYMQAVATALFDPARWKNEFGAVNPQCGGQWAIAAAIWFHGAMPQSVIDDDVVVVKSNGYACD